MSNKTHSYQTTKHISSKEVYPIHWDEFDNLEFRPPKNGERYHAATNQITVKTAEWDWDIDLPRFIIPKRRKWVIEETGEVRVPQKGELYSLYPLNDKGFTVIPCQGQAMSAYPIVTIREE